MKEYNEEEVDESLLDPSLLNGLNENDRREALAAAAAAKRAEERAEQKAIERAIRQKEIDRKAEEFVRQQQQQQQQQQHSEIRHNVNVINESDRVVFVPKKRRGIDNNNNNNNNNDSFVITDSETKKIQQQSGSVVPMERDKYNNNGSSSLSIYSEKTKNVINSSSSQKQKSQSTNIQSDNNNNYNNNNVLLSETEMKTIRQTYLGKSAATLNSISASNNNNVEEEEKRKKKLKTTTTNKKITFKFRWDESDDTFNDNDPLYSSMIPVPASRNNNNNYNNSNNNSNYNNTKNSNYSRHHHHQNSGNSNKNTSSSYSSQTVVTKKRNNNNNIIFDDISNVETVKTKPLNKMTTRDWRIFRENYDIVVKGGKVPPPMRTFYESPLPDIIPILHSSLLDSITNIFKFKEPSPIQRQAIPIGLQRRDLIGIAETGSGKTIAFGLPLCHYLLNVPENILSSVAENGPLALVMAPTRELALQIDIELKKLLCKQNTIRTCPIVGGQQIQAQAQEIRTGVHIIVGTPGRINDCIEMSYLVLNQCCYIVMDEADRMIDMGFAPQMESILNAMGGSLKSENETIAYQQELEDLKHSNDIARHRLTAMFSATMPLEVERIAKQYLRHPAIISIGDQDSGKNARIIQKLVWVASINKKEDALRTLLRDPKFIKEKIIVFVNEKKHADNVGRMVERSGRQCVVLHGGKSQEQREENLEIFRRGGIVMVATDVAGRGLDIPDVAHIINYDLPTRNIETYTHRIGRTGRAGKIGYATSLISDDDIGIMAQLRSYLESTGNDVPDRLARHSSSQSSAPASIMY